MKVKSYFKNPDGKPRCQFTVGCVVMGLNSIAAAMQMNTEFSLDKRWSPELKKAAASFLKEMGKYQRESRELQERETNAT